MKKNTTTKKSPKKAQAKERSQIRRLAAKQKLTIGASCLPLVGSLPLQNWRLIT